jgi:hypothetical protein
VLEVLQRCEELITETDGCVMTHEGQMFSTEGFDAYVVAG